MVIICPHCGAHNLIYPPMKDLCIKCGTKLDLNTVVKTYRKDKMRKKR